MWGFFRLYIAAIKRLVHFPLEKAFGKLNIRPRNHLHFHATLHGVNCGPGTENEKHWMSVSSDASLIRCYNGKLNFSMNSSFCPFWVYIYIYWYVYQRDKTCFTRQFSPSRVIFPFYLCAFQGHVNNERRSIFWITFLVYLSTTLA